MPKIYAKISYEASVSEMYILVKKSYLKKSKMASQNVFCFIFLTFLQEIEKILDKFGFVLKKLILIRHLVSIHHY
jgi:hypothetical protein